MAMFNSFLYVYQRVFWCILVCLKIVSPKSHQPPLVMTNITMENHHAINGKIHYFFMGKSTIFSWENPLFFHGKIHYFFMGKSTIFSWENPLFMGKSTIFSWENPLFMGKSIQWMIIFGVSHGRSYLASGGAKLLKHAVVKAVWHWHAGSGKCQSLQTNGCV